MQDFSLNEISEFYFLTFNWLLQFCKTWIFWQNAPYLSTVLIIFKTLTFSMYIKNVVHIFTKTVAISVMRDLCKICHNLLAHRKIFSSNESINLSWLGSRPMTSCVLRIRSKNTFINPRKKMLMLVMFQTIAKHHSRWRRKPAKPSATRQINIHELKDREER